MTTKEKEKINWMKWIMRIGIALLVACGIVGGCTYINKKIGMKDDHAIEEIIEGFILENTELDIDLTPITPE